MPLLASFALIVIAAACATLGVLGSFLPLSSAAPSTPSPRPGQGSPLSEAPAQRTLVLLPPQVRAQLVAIQDEVFVRGNAEPTRVTALYNLMTALDGLPDADVLCSDATPLWRDVADRTQAADKAFWRTVAQPLFEEALPEAIHSVMAKYDAQINADRLTLQEYIEQETSDSPVTMTVKFLTDKPGEILEVARSILSQVNLLVGSFDTLSCADGVRVVTDLSGAIDTSRTLMTIIGSTPQYFYCIIIKKMNDGDAFPHECSFLDVFRPDGDPWELAATSASSRVYIDGELRSEPDTMEEDMGYWRYLARHQRAAAPADAEGRESTEDRT